MIIDINQSRAWPFQRRHQVCVCGTGPAGMTVARELAARGVSVLLLEAGGFDLSSQSQDVYGGNSVGPLEYYGVSSCRLRMFGGTSNHWAGRCGIFERVDFEPRDIWGMPGWPISYEEAYRRLDGASEILDLGGQSLDPPDEPHWSDSRFRPAGFARSGPTRFGEKYRAELNASAMIDTLINANVVGATFSENGAAVSSLMVADYEGRKYSVEADRFVIAFGAIENARFLLNVGDQTGVPVGNAGDFVGRCFMEHFDIRLGRFMTVESPIWRTNDAHIFNLDADLTRARKFGTATINVQPGAQPSFYGRLAPLRRMANAVTCGMDAFRPGGHTSRTALCRGDGVVTNIMEQTPDRNSRVMLDKSSKDRFGNYRIALDWRLNDQDIRTISGLAEEMGKSFAAQNIGRLQISNDILEGKPRPGYHCHQMGTTRMSNNPNDGVVDPDSKVHGVRNLYVAGSSVFPTGGGINPTLTIVALSLRLGEHIAAATARG